jgi:hypothetical protein
MHASIASGDESVATCSPRVRRVSFCVHGPDGLATCGRGEGAWSVERVVELRRKGLQSEVSRHHRRARPRAGIAHARVERQPTSTATACALFPLARATSKCRTYGCMGTLGKRTCWQGQWYSAPPLGGSRTDDFLLAALNKLQL